MRSGGTPFPASYRKERRAAVNVSENSRCLNTIPRKRYSARTLLALSDSDGEGEGDNSANEAGNGTNKSEESETEQTAPRPDEAVGPVEENVDWDAAWKNTQQRIVKDKKNAPAFSGRKQIIARKIGEDEWDFEEIPAQGAPGPGGTRNEGFRFADNSYDGGDIQSREQQTVDMATTNKAFAGLFALLAATLCFYVYVYLSGGISNGATRFEGMGQPTTYDALPLPAVPHVDIESISV